MLLKCRKAFWGVRTSYSLRFCATAKALLGHGRGGTGYITGLARRPARTFQRIGFLNSPDHQGNSAFVTTCRVVMLKKSFIVAAVLLAGCASSNLTTGSSGGHIPGSSRIAVHRDTSFMYMAVDARLDLNGERVASLGRGDGYLGDVKPGKTVLTTDAWSSPGRYSITFDARPDTDYLFEISPRSDSMAIGMLGGIVGLAAEASVSDNSGSFQIDLKSVDAPNPPSRKRM